LCIKQKGDAQNLPCRQNRPARNMLSSIEMSGGAQRSRDIRRIPNIAHPVPDGTKTARKYFYVNSTFFAAHPSGYHRTRDKFIPSRFLTPNFLHPERISIIFASLFEPFYMKQTKFF
jgi:hypothetical protein